MHGDLCLADEEIEAWSQLAASLSFGNNSPTEPSRPEYRPWLQHHHFCLYFQCFSYFCSLSCHLMQPVSSCCPSRLDRRRNLRQDRLCLTVRNHTAEFHQKCTCSFSGIETFQWCFITASPGLHMMQTKTLNLKEHLSLFGVAGLPTSSIS